MSPSNISLAPATLNVLEPLQRKMARVDLQRWREHKRMPDKLDAPKPKGLIVGERAAGK